MLKEIPHIRQDGGGQKRRWFTDEYVDLVVWLDENDDIIEFQLCYDKTSDERALTWRKESAYMHDRVDPGESKPGRTKASPVLTVDGLFEHERIAGIFKEKSRDIDNKISEFVCQKLLQYPSSGG